MTVRPPPLSPTSIVQILAATIALALAGVLVAIVSSVRRKMRAAKQLAPVRGPKGVFLLGFIPELTKNIHRAYDFIAETIIASGGRAHIPWTIFTENMLYITDPADIEHVYSTNFYNWVKSDHFILSVGEVFGKALLGINHAHTVDGGAMFRIQRKVITKIFTTSNFKVFTEGIFYKCAMRTVDLIHAQNGKVEMHTLSSQFTLQTIFEVVCGVDLQSIDEEFGLKFIESMDFVFGSIPIRTIFKPYFKYFWWCMPSEYRLKRESRRMLDLVDGILKERLREREEQIAKRSDILSMFIKKARQLGKEGKTVLDIPTLRSIVTATVFAGRDTSSSVILYTFYALAQYPEQQSKILDELKPLSNTALTYDDVKNLTYLDAFVWETVRLYPTTPSTVKQAAEDDVFPDGTFVPAKTEILVSSYYMGRYNAKLWGDDLLVFRPERWLEMKTRPTPYEFPLFQGGPRMCPGRNMALLETKLLVAIMLPKFHMAVQEGYQVKDRPYMVGPSLMMKDGLPLQFTPRQAPAH